MKLKILVALCAIVVLAVGAFWFLRRGSRSNEAHYAALEKQRQEQAAQMPAAAPAATAAPVAQASPSASPDASQGQTAAPAATTGRNYWTNFRGPKRDGNYD